MTVPRPRRALVAGVTLALGSSLALIPAPAHAAPIVFKVVGTADVFDSNLVQSVLEPRFEAQYPQYDLQYTTGGTGKAITLAKTGAFAAMIVHAAGLENQFVADGFSTEPAGRAVFWGDYILIGPASDPAGVLNGSTHDIVTAFEKIAAAGVAGTADFASRGGTPGTSVQERFLWGLSTGVPTCNVNAVEGGGKLPSNTAGNCPSAADTPTPHNIDNTDVPAWYHINAGASQAANIQAGNACNYAARSGKCYVFTDRGTFNYLQATAPAPGLSLNQQVRTNDPAARGGFEALINYFHAYSINPAAVPAGQTDTVAARLFLDFLTSPATQTAVGQYLNSSNDPPFIPAAAPALTGKFASTEAKAGKKSVVTGHVKNVVPGTPVLSGVIVNLLEAASSSPLAIPKIVAAGVTDANGDFSIKYALKSGKNYRVGVGAITKLERPDLSPTFSDILTGTSTQIGTVGGVKIKSLTKLSHGRVKIMAKAKPAASTSGKVTIYAAQKGKLKKIGKVKLNDGESKVTATERLGPGKWKIRLVYKTDGVLTGVSQKETVSLS